MIRVITGIGLAVASALAPIFVDCSGGCQREISNGLVNPPSALHVSFPATTFSGSCLECSSCGGCSAAPCKFDGTLSITNGFGPVYPPMYFRVNGSPAYTELHPSKTWSVDFIDQEVACGKGWVISDLKFDGQAYAGEIRCRCTDCPLPSGN